MRANVDIREAAKKAGVHLWQVAEVYGMNDGNFSRKLRKELPQEEKEKILEIIDRLAQEQQGVALCPMWLLFVKLSRGQRLTASR